MLNLKQLNIANKSSIKKLIKINFKKYLTNSTEYVKLITAKHIQKISSQKTF